MSRRRSADKAIPISIALPRTIVARLDQVLAYKDSRSAYVARAIKKQLDDRESFNIREVPTSRLRMELYIREETSAALKLALNAEEVNSSSSPSEDS
jgi:metal-responsive CopG/Arc/MetJ family transcriptional regulator